MWARTAEAMLGLWLIASPFLFDHPPDVVWLWAMDMGPGLGITILALLSHARSLPRAHFLNAIPAAVLVIAGFLGSSGAFDAAAQNRLVVGLVLLMLVIVPNEAIQPPTPWRDRQR